MRLTERLGCTLLLTLALASCNTSDTLTPQAEIGSGRRTSTPVTQADTERMAGNPATSSNTAQNRSMGPQNTLQAQAEAMQDGSASPASSGPPVQQESESPLPATGQSQQNASLPSAATATGTIRFLPIIGAPVQAVTPLSRQLGAQARASGLTIRPSGDTSTEHILKGYFSAFADEGKVTVIYVWDVLDGTGNRLHRMQGQAVVPAKGSDPWTAVPASTMEEIAAKTIQDYLSWRQSRAG
ncbi:hypothetical protein EPK99_08465 [Neorhizobium lilium]|uniref:Lipoprotein n=1 Tax=Neorhizobium lilium TaxID=2503024 RepID=A0A444LHS7_9HYPH|nr:hypothetical protein [Neorhizobium lilium]RWX78622.1 hypothetical protein EPK99_08465 [Neorhizobium lilium]